MPYRCPHPLIAAQLRRDFPLIACGPYQIFLQHGRVDPLRRLCLAISSSDPTVDIVHIDQDNEDGYALAVTLLVRMNAGGPSVPLKDETIRKVACARDETALLCQNCGEDGRRMRRLRRNSHMSLTLYQECGDFMDGQMWIWAEDGADN
ncbi:hypothetical protein HMN09_00994100 [Mycena chlorophos]|uniref:Uncharacterized protein n=1 Tax=Mycena chlorophos TaxID=658473 RepID=A0A8H6SHQ8_MYCCL|nr:hypothetical protein HMN09_00994100 [Mycena chlorophos]